MKRKLIAICTILLVSLLLPAAVFGKPHNNAGKNKKVEQITVDTSERVIPGGDKIHIIKVFEEARGTDAILLESNGHYAMVDVGVPFDFNFGGAQDRENSVVNYLSSYGVERLDYIILTHMHVDHVGNLENVLRSISVGKVYVREIDFPSGCVYFYGHKPVKQVCSAYGIPEEEISEGQTLKLGNLTLKAYNLDDDLKVGKSMENRNSMGILVTNGYGHKAFLAGDIDNYDGDEDRMVQNHAKELKNVDYLKAGHHGYPGSSTYDFISMLNPLYVGVSGSRISRQADPFGNGNSVMDNYSDTRAAYNDAFFTMYDSNNGVIFDMGEKMSINSTYEFPSRRGRAKNTLSVYYNANGGSIRKAYEDDYYINPSGNICTKTKDKESNNVHERAKEGVLAPMYFYDMNRALENPETFGLERVGHTFDGWYNDVNRKQIFQVNNAYDVEDLAPDLNQTSATLVLSARWKANSYKIIFNPNGGLGTMAEQDCIYNKREYLEPNSFSRKQYIFLGWNTRKDGSGETFRDGAMIKNLTTKADEEIVFYAQWEKLGVGSPQDKLLALEPSKDTE